jgi:hypothetical protein
VGRMVTPTQGFHYRKAKGRVIYVQDPRCHYIHDQVGCHKPSHTSATGRNGRNSKKVPTHMLQHDYATKDNDKRTSTHNLTLVRHCGRNAESAAFPFSLNREYLLRRKRLI